MQPEVNELVLCRTPDEVVALIESPGYRERFVANYRPEVFPTPGGFNRIIVLANDEPSAADQYCGRTLGDIAEERGTHVVDALLDVIHAAGGHFRYRTAAFLNPDPVLAKKYWDHPRVLAGASDGGAHVKSMALGCWTTFFLIDRVREQQIVSLEEMVHQMTLKPAAALGLHDRGSIEQGKAADLVIFRLDDLFFDMSQYDHVYTMPNNDWRKMARAGGYSYIVVNGEITHDHDKPTGVTPGRLIAPVPAA
jgi:N-acyl-D-aspartate/D-glutamate deacylase